MFDWVLNKVQIFEKKNSFKNLFFLKNDFALLDKSLEPCKLS